MLLLVLLYVFIVPSAALAQVPIDNDSLKKAPIDTSSINKIKGAKGSGGQPVINQTVVKDTSTKAQSTATSTTTPVDSSKYKHSPRKATLMSALLPGLGQIYNRKWWKVPIIYGGFAGVGYAIGFNQKYYSDFKKALVYRLDGNPNTVDDYVGKYSSANLDELQRYYRKNRDLSIIIAVGVYLLNVIDANVDAHLFDFDVSNDLSLNIRPAQLPAYGRPVATPGLSLTLKFK